MTFSVLVPARDEEDWIGGCFDSIAAAAATGAFDVETIVVLNRCTDGTERIARERGAVVVQEDRRCLSCVRNAGAAVAKGDVLVTMDADSRMAENTFVEIKVALESGKYIGGGVPIVPKRKSVGVVLTGLVLMLLIMPGGISAGLFWCFADTFRAIGGFDESKVIAEDLDFARRLKEYGRACGLRFRTLWRAPIVTSCRKFDRFGDWCFLRFMVSRPRDFARALRGTDPQLADEFFYDFERRSKKITGREA
jgi:glycosyltransferase involved in cell wall biosynthesis